MPLAVTGSRAFGRSALVVAAMVLAVAGVAGCGDSSTPVPPPLSQAAIDAALATTPPGLSAAQRALDEGANTVLKGDGDDALGQLEAELAPLRGKPVVVNLWADWCKPCVKEFPIFQRTALELRGDVAFLGVATRTSRAKTEGFLAKLALPYPSILDPDEQVNKSVTGVENIPKTFFYKPGGGKPFVHLGPYDSVDKLKADIARYAS